MHVIAVFGFPPVTVDPEPVGVAAALEASREVLDEDLGRPSLARPRRSSSSPSAGREEPRREERGTPGSGPTGRRRAARVGRIR